MSEKPTDENAAIQPAPVPRPVLAVSAAIFHAEKVLLVRRAQAPARDFYTLPGGRVEWGETLEQALAREIAEETALEIEIIGLAGYREMLLPAPGAVTAHFVILPFAARARTTAVRLNEELSDFRWVAPQAVADYRTTEGLAEIVAAAARLAGLGR